MTKKNLPDIDGARQKAAKRLGTDMPVCTGGCGETDPLVMELHHIAGAGNDEKLLATVCRNCHRKLSDPSANGRPPADPPLLERAGHLLIGLAEFFLLLAARLKALGRELLDGARVCPPPYGWGNQ